MPPTRRPVTRSSRGGPSQRKPSPMASRPETRPIARGDQPDSSDTPPAPPSSYQDIMAAVTLSITQAIRDSEQRMKSEIARAVSDSELRMKKTIAQAVTESEHRMKDVISTAVRESELRTKTMIWKEFGNSERRSKGLITQKVRDPQAHIQGRIQKTIYDSLVSHDIRIKGSIAKCRTDLEARLGTRLSALEGGHASSSNPAEGPADGTVRGECGDDPAARLAAVSSAVDARCFAVEERVDAIVQDQCAAMQQRVDAAVKAKCAEVERKEASRLAQRQAEWLRNLRSAAHEPAVTDLREQVSDEDLEDVDALRSDLQQWAETVDTLGETMEQLEAELKAEMERGDEMWFKRTGHRVMIGARR